MPVRYPRVLIVSAPTATRTVLYDFNDDTQSLTSGSKTDLSAAEWSFGQLNLQGDPDSVGVEWGLQQLSFSQTVTGPKFAALLRQAAMSKALLQQRFWVEFQLTAATQPVWWHAYRTPPGELSLDQVYVSDVLGDRWNISGTIDIDPFSYGARVTLPTQTVGNNPANEASAPASGFSLSTLKGDAPTNLRVKITPSVSTPLGPQRWLVAVVNSDGAKPFRAPIGTGDGFSALNGASAAASNADSVNGTSRTVSFTQGTTRLTRLSGQLPRTNVAPGRYFVLLRCAATSSAGTTISAQLTANADASFGVTPFGPVVSTSFPETTGQVDNYQVLPLGVIGINDGMPEDLALIGVRQVLLSIGSSDPNATLRLDEFVLIPVAGPGLASTTTLMLDTRGGGASAAYPLMVDGDTETSFVRNMTDGSIRVSGSGGYPQADPACALSTLLVMPLAGASLAGQVSADRPTGLNATAQVEVSYHPRSAWIGDGT